MRPSTKEYVASKQAEQKLHHDKWVKHRSLMPGDAVTVRNYRGSNKWIPGIVIKTLGPVTYSVGVANGQVWKRHIDQLRLFEDSSQSASPPEVTQADSPVLDDFQYPTVEEPPHLKSRQSHQRHLHNAILRNNNDHPIALWVFLNIELFIS